MSASSPAIKRIMQECKNLRKNPSNFIIAAPLEDDLFEWHFTIKGAAKTEFEGGKYHGKFILPAEYPFKAPDIIMLTKSGRFEIGKKICLNFTGYHHELWQPAWTIRTMLTALRAFMETKAKGVGAISVDKEQRKKYAKISSNYKCPKCDVFMRDVQFLTIQKDTGSKTQTQNQNNNNNVNDNSETQTEIETETETNENIINDDVDDEIINNQEVQEIEPLSVNEISVQNEAAPPSTKDKFLDSITVFLVMLIAAILLKKFAFKVMEQL